MAISEAFIYRMSITRAQSLSLVVLMVALDWLLRNKIKRLAGLAFVYVWLYNAFPLLLIVAGVFVAARWILERKLDLRPLVSVGAGTFLGLIINPYFPYNIIFAVQHILPKLFEPTSVSVGSEWYPYTTAQLLENSLLALAAFVSGALALGLQEKRIDLRTLVSFLLAGVFGLMMFQSRRFIEYFPPFALVFAAFAWAPIMGQAKIRLRGLSIQLASLVFDLDSYSRRLVYFPGFTGRACKHPSHTRPTPMLRPGWLRTRLRARACSRPIGMISLAFSSITRRTPT